MLTPAMLLLATVAAAQHENATLLIPTRNQAVPTDAFTLKWAYDFDYSGLFTLLLSPPTKSYWTDYVVSTAVFAEESSTSLPASVLPSVALHDTSLLDLILGTTMAGPQVFSVSLVGTPATVTATVTATSTVTSEVQEGGPKDDGGGLRPVQKLGLASGLAWVLSWSRLGYSSCSGGDGGAGSPRPYARSLRLDQLQLFSWVARGRNRRR